MYTILMDTHILLFYYTLIINFIILLFLDLFVNPSPFLMQQKKYILQIYQNCQKKIMKNKDKLLNAKDSELKCILKLLCIVNILIPPYIKKKKNTLEDIPNSSTPKI